MKKVSYDTSKRFLFNTETKFTTVALKSNQHLQSFGSAGMVETFLKGFTDGKRDESLDGYYYNSEIQTKS